MATSIPADRLLLSPTRRAILRLLEDPGDPGDPRDPGGSGKAGDAAEGDGGRRGRTAAQVAEGLGLHVTTVRFHLEQLVSVGLVTTELRRGSVGRPRKVYVDARSGPGGLASPGALNAFTELLTSAWAGAASGTPADPETAGREWVEHHADEPAAPPATTPGTWLGKVGRAVDLLEEWGYQPEIRTTAGGRTVEMTLHDCPFMSMARVHGDVVCGIHRGLIRGTLAAVGERDADLDLRPFVTDRTCVARLTSAGLGARRPTGD